MAKAIEKTRHRWSAHFDSFDSMIGSLLQFKSLEGSYSWHYTSLQSFVSIIESKSLRISHIRHLQDKNEQHQFHRLVAELSEVPGRANLSEYIFNTLCLMPSVISRVMTNTYLLSNTLSDDALAMWNIYGDGGKGVAIRFSDAFPLVNRDFCKINRVDAFSGMVIYDPKQFVSRLVESINKFEAKHFSPQDIRDLYELTPESPQETFLYAAVARVCGSAYFFKDLSFSFENEVRTGISLTKNAKIDSSVKFHVKDGNLKEFVEIDVQNLISSEEFEIILGPLVTQNQTEAITSFLSKNNVKNPENKIRSSKHRLQEK